MSSYVFDGWIRCTYCPTVANIAAPTVAELNAGTALEGFITPDGLDITPKDASVDTSTLKNAADTAKPGRISYDVSVEFLRDDSSDVAWNLFVRGLNGYLVVRDNMDSSTAWAAAQKVAVYPVTAGAPKKAKIAVNKRQTFTSAFFMGGASNQVPNERAVVA